MRAPAAMRSSTLVVVLVATLTRAQEDEVALYSMEPDAWPGAETDDFGLPAFRERKIKVQHLSPSYGGDAGGLLVNVTGKGFVVATDPKCQFGGEDTMIVNATVKSANFIQCWSPPNAETDGGIPWTRSYDIYSRVVEVSLNGVDWTTSSKPFTYYDHSKLMVSLVEPQGGPIAGGTEITVHGSMFQQSDNLKCRFRRDTGGAGCGDSSAPAILQCDKTPDVVVDATILNYWSIRCISPTGFPESIGGKLKGVLPSDGYQAYVDAGGIALPLAAGDNIASTPTVTTVEVALDEYHYTSHGVEFHYYDHQRLAISAIDPIGGPTAGGTLIEVFGSGFAELGGQVMHGAKLFGNHSWDPFRLIDKGTFCKFSLTSDSRSLVEFACTDAQCTEGKETYDGLLTSGAQVMPLEGQMALLDAASNSHLVNFSAFTESTTPSLGKWSSVVRATFVGCETDFTGCKMLCESPPYHGTLTDNRVKLNVHLTLNSDFHDLNALSRSNATFDLYDPREARVNFMTRQGGPLAGNTSVEIRGKLFDDYTLRSMPVDPTQQAIAAPREHLLRCRFGWAGETLATLVDEKTVRCFSPLLNQSETPLVLNSGHADDVPVDLTLNGQDYLNGRNLRFIYSPRDEYQMNGSCFNEWNQVINEGTICRNTYMGISVHWLQPMGGPSDGGTRVMVMGQHFAVRGPSIECAFGSLPRVMATFVNDTAVVCVSPPAPEVAGTFEDFNLDITINGDTNFLTDSKVPFVYYNHTATLSVTSIYPQAGSKRGGNLVTIYGTGFRVLGGINEKGCMGLSETINVSTINVSTGVSDDELVGHRICRNWPEDENTNRGLQCIFGNMPPVHAFQVLTTENMRSSHPVVTAITCEAPKLPPEELDKAGLTPDDIIPVCVEVTLNGNTTQATTNCVEFTYYDF